MSTTTFRQLVWSLLLVAIVVRVPFDFRAGGTHFRPGEYVVELDGGAAVSATIRGKTPGTGAVLVLRRSPEAARGRTPTVAFRTYGDHRFLSAIETAEGERFEIAPSPDETTLTRTHGSPKVTSLRAHALEKR